MTYALICQHPPCGQPFQAKRPTGAYCSPKCRIAAWKDRQPVEAEVLRLNIGVAVILPNDWPEGTKVEVRRVSS